MFKSLGEEQNISNTKQNKEPKNKNMYSMFTSNTKLNSQNGFSVSTLVKWVNKMFFYKRHNLFISGIKKYRNMAII